MCTGTPKAIECRILSVGIKVCGPPHSIASPVHQTKAACASESLNPWFLRLCGVALQVKFGEAVDEQWCFSHVIESVASCSELVVF